MRIFPAILMPGIGIAGWFEASRAAAFPEAGDRQEWRRNRVV
jgi:hypothetical protein